MEAISPTLDERAPAAQGAAPGQARGLATLGREMAVITPGLVAYNLAYLALAWLVAVAVIALAWLHPAIYTIALAVLVVSSRQQALLNVEHEAIHRKLLPSGPWNALVGRWLCAAPVGSPYGASAARHLSHHRLLSTPEDPDHNLHSGEDKRSRRGLLRHFAGGLLGGYAGMILMGPRVPTSEAEGGSGRYDFVSIAVCQLLVAAALTLAFDWWVYPALWLTPLLTVTVLSHLIRSFVEHAISEQESAGHSNRLITISSHPLERSMIAPYGMNYHAEHHVLPSVPAVRLKRLRRRLADEAAAPTILERGSYRAALSSYFRALRG